jgi:hypothetical protein
MVARKKEDLGVVQVLTHKIETDVAADEAQQMVFRNLIFDAQVVEQRLRAGALPHHGHEPPRMAIKHSIRNSRLLMTFLHCTHKHQLSDFFNTYLPIS